MRQSIAAALMAFGLLSRCAAQAPASIEKPQFDVASVRQNKSDDKPSSNFSLDSGNIFSMAGKDTASGPGGTLFSATNQSLLTYISFAYKLTGTQYLSLRFKEYLGQPASLPQWATRLGWNIQARAEGNPTKDQARLMMQALLEDRFKLAVHRETGETPVSALVFVKPGAHISPHPKDDDCASERAGLPPVCGIIAHLSPSVPGRLSFGGRNVTLTQLAESFPTQTGMATLPRPVVDKTGLQGGFDFSFEWVPEGATDVPGPNFAEALRDQLGLKLVTEKGAVELVVIDHLEQPSGN